LDGAIYGIPAHADSVLKIQPETGEVKTIGPQYGNSMEQTEQTADFSQRPTGPPWKRWKRKSRFADSLTPQD